MYCFTVGFLLSFRCLLALGLNLELFVLFRSISVQRSDWTSLRRIRLHSSYATFVYSQPQAIWPDSYLGDVSDWDHYLSVDLTSSDLPFKSVTDFLKNKDLADLVKQSDLPTPTHFVEQSLSFYKSLCTLLLKHNVRRSKFVRGMSNFDVAVILHWREEDYNEELEQLCDFFVQRDWISDTVKPLVLSEYRSFVEKFRSVEPDYDTDWVTFSLFFLSFIAVRICCPFSSYVASESSILPVLYLFLL